MSSLELPIVQVSEVAAEFVAGRGVVINRDPGPNEVGAPRDGAIAFEAIDLGNTGVVEVYSAISVGGEWARLFGVWQSGFSGTVTAIPDGVRYEIERATAFDSEEEVVVSITGRTTDSVPFSETWSFEIEDYSAPVLIAAQARDGETARLEFSEDVEIPAGASFTFEPVTAPAVGVSVVASSSSGSLIDLTLDRPLSPGATYKVAVSGVVDLANNEILAGSSAYLVGFCREAPEGRSFDLWSMLPAYNRRADLSGDLRLMIQVYQELADLMLCEIDRFREVFDVERTPDAFLDAILFGLGNPFDTSSLDVAKKRRLAASLVQIYQSKGTAQGIKDVVRFFMGLEIEILPLGRSGGRLGEARLEVDLILGSSDPRVLYSFVIVSPRELSDEERAELEALVLYMKPAREHLAAIREPDDPPPGAWILGEDRIGSGSILS